MVRSIAANLLLALSLFLASLAMTTFWFTHTALDPTRSARVAGAVLESPKAQEAVRSFAADEMVQSGTLGSEGARAVSEKLLSTPELRQQLADAAARSLSSRESVPLVDPGSPLDPSSLVAGLDPRVGDVLSQQLAQARLPALGGVTEAMALATRTLALVAGAFAALALLIHPVRALVLRRVGKMLLAISAGHVVFLGVIPLVIAANASSPVLALVAVAMTELGRNMVLPLAALSATGVASLVLARLIRR